MLCSGPRSQLAGWRLVPYSDRNSELRSDGGICTKDCNPSGNFRPPTSVRRRAGAVVVPHACRHGRAGTPCTGRSRTAPRRRGRCLPSRIVHCAARGAWRMLRVGSRCANTMRRTATVVTRRDSFALIQRPLAARTNGGAAAGGGLEGCVCVCACVRVRVRVLCVLCCCVCARARAVVARPVLGCGIDVRGRVDKQRLCRVASLEACAVSYERRVGAGLH